MKALKQDNLAPGVEHTGGAKVEALHLKKRVRKGINLLQDISLYIHPHELVVFVGLSGAGKTTLMDALSGYRPATEGEVLVDGTNLYENFDSFRTSIGFVPQREIMHMDLTVFEALDYAARLRMPPGTSATTRHQRIQDVLADLDLTEQRDVRVRAISGGQQKRVSIGIELITSPRLFFLDEPTSGLDPSTEVELMQLLRKLTEQGRTILVTTHSTKNMLLADKVLFMVRGGYVAWYGPPDEALAYFDSHYSEHERSGKAIQFHEVYELVEDPQKGTPQEWAERYMAHPAYQRYIAEPLHLAPPVQQEIAGEQSARLQAHKKKSASGTSPAPRQAGSLRQLAILSARNLKLLSRDRIGLILTLIAPPILTSLVLVLTYRKMFDPLDGNPTRITLSITLLLFVAMAIGAMSFMQEIVKEKEIYRRERHVNLKIIPYVLSKVWIVTLFALYQALCWFVGLYLAVDMPGGMATAVAVYITLFLTTLIGMLMGLLGSCLAPTVSAAPLLTAMLVMPQVMFSGALLPMTQLNGVGVGITTVMPARFAFEAIITASGYGQQVSSDPNWQLPAAQRLALTDEQTRGSACLGKNIFTECNFPGIRQFYNPAVDQPPPVQPQPPSGTTISQQAFANYLNALAAYQKKYASWQSLRSQAIGGAEARIAIDDNSFGPIYNVNLLIHWLALLITSVILVGAMVGIQKAKDVV